MQARRVLFAFVISAVVAAACGGATVTQTPTPTPAASTGATATPAASATSGATATPGIGATATPSGAPGATPTAAATASPAPTATPAATATLGPPATATPIPVVTPSPLATPGPVIIGPASLVAPDSVPADTLFKVDWVGPNNTGDYIAIIAASKRKWSGEPYFYTYGGTPKYLQASTQPGAYEIRYIGGNKKVLARRSITVTAFVGSLDGPANVGAGKEFDVAWTGPASPGDYITIEPLGATKWTAESFFYLYQNHVGTLTAPLAAGNYELWYVAGDKTVMLREPITVDSLQASVSGPASAVHGANFSVSWTGPDATGDFITIVAVGAAEGSYLAYAYTTYGNPATLAAPTTPGQYELRYVYGSSRETLAIATIQIT